MLGCVCREAPRTRDLAVIVSHLALYRPCKLLHGLPIVGSRVAYETVCCRHTAITLLMC